MTPDRGRLGTEDGEHARAPCGKQAWDGIEEKTPQPQHRGKAGQKKEESGHVKFKTSLSYIKTLTQKKGQGQKED